MQVVARSTAVSTIGALATYVTGNLIGLDSPYPSTISIAVATFIFSTILQLKKKSSDSSDSK